MWRCARTAAAEIAGRSRGTPRIANRLLRRVRDFAEVKHDGVVTLEIASAALELYEVDVHGLDRLDRAVLRALVTRFAGGPVGLSTLAVAVGEEAETVEVVAEPFLVREGLIARTPRGRVATPAAWEHLGLAAPDTASLARPGNSFRRRHRYLTRRGLTWARTGRVGMLWSRGCHDRSRKAIACWCAACAPLHFGSWPATPLCVWRGVRTGQRLGEATRAQQVNGKGAP